MDNKDFEKWWKDFGRYEEPVNNHLELENCLKIMAKHAFDYFEPENKRLKAKLLEYELKYDNE